MPGYSLETSPGHFLPASFPGDEGVCWIPKHKPSLEESHTDPALAGGAPPKGSRTATLGASG